MALETRKDRIYRILEQALTPSTLLVIDDSNRHAGHIGSSPSGETHFQVKVSSPLFKGVPLVEQHRKIYGLLATELKNGLHALEIESKD